MDFVKRAINKIATRVRDLFQKPTPPQIFPRSKVYEVDSAPVHFDPEKIRPTKAYADQRQKAPHNRRHKPGKHLRNLYKLA